MRDRRKILTVVGARPQFVKAAVVSRAIRDGGWSDQLEEVLVHTGQHYDSAMSDLFFKDMEIKKPEYHFTLSSSQPNHQISEMTSKLDDVFNEEKPDSVIVYGDTNSTLSGALATSKLE